MSSLTEFTAASILSSKQNFLNFKRFLQLIPVKIHHNIHNAHYILAVILTSEMKILMSCLDDGDSGFNMANSASNMSCKN